MHVVETFLSGSNPAHPLVVTGPTGNYKKMAFRPGEPVPGLFADLPTVSSRKFMWDSYLPPKIYLPKINPFCLNTVGNPPENQHSCTLKACFQESSSMPCDRRSVAPCHSPNCSRQAPCNDPLSPRSPTNYTSSLGWLNRQPEPGSGAVFSLLISAVKSFIPKTEGKSCKFIESEGKTQAFFCWNHAMLTFSCGQWSGGSIWTIGSNTSING